jgi:hypothetical protein
METNNEQAAPVEPTVAPTEAPGAPQESAPDVSGGTPDAPSGAEPSPYTPDYKFKSLGQEFEIDEEYRGYIKSQEDEKRIKRMFEQIKGVGRLKNEWNDYRSKVEKYEPLVEKAQQYDSAFEMFNQLVQSGQVKQAFDLFQIPQDVIFKAALQYMDYDALPQQHKEVYSQLQSERLARGELQRQIQANQSELQAIRSQTRASELTTVLSQPEVKSIAEKYDQAYGAGSFRAQVIKRGSQHFAATGEDLSAQKVAEEFIQIVKPFMAQQAQSPTPTKDLPVIPATGPSTSSAPGARHVKSLDDLRNIRKEKFGY